MASNISSISQALAATAHRRGNAAAGHDANKTFLSVHGGVKNALRRNGLPTPPNSISPNLPPQGFKAKALKEVPGASLRQLDSDIDLDEAVGHVNSHSMSFSSLAEPLYPAEEYGFITPTYLARTHLPAIVLDQGPIAIRTVMNILAETVPGFSDIPPAKARRIVVSALENRAGGGMKGDVEFEKVGWGKWDARIKGQTVARERSRRIVQESPISPPTLSAFSFSRSDALRIPGSNRPGLKMRRPSSRSWMEETVTAGDVNRESFDMVEDEADKMSIDGDEAAPHDLPDEEGSYEVPFYSDTDTEDWAGMGPAALRESSFSGGGRSRYLSTSLKTRSRHLSARPISSRSVSHCRSNFAPLDFTGMDVDCQEQVAIEALMRMGSM